jgi:1,4-dihydroxy-2-naphthoate polyprenyltransferase
MIKTVFATLRPPFLLLPPVTVTLGLATALASGHTVSTLYFVLALAGGLLAHAGVNSLNEYLDFKSGLDHNTQRTPFSGGSGALPSNPGAAKAVLTTSVICLLLTALIGLYFVNVRGWQLAPLGLLGIVIIISYTGWINRHPLICLIAPGLGFGPLMVIGTHFVLTGEYALLPAVVSLVPFFLVNNLLLLNQFPDIEADREAGRRHLIIRYGIRSGIIAYLLFVLLACAVTIAAVHQSMVPTAGLIALAPLMLAIWIIAGVKNQPDDNPRLVPYLGLNVFVTLITPAILVAALILR